MPLGQFENVTDVGCAAPLLDQALFGPKGGYIAGRYCGLGSFEDGTTCCFPCPIQDWLYPPEWKQQLRVPNFLSILSVALCCFLLLSFAVLPPEATHRHYLSVGLLFPVLFISLSFVIPVGVDPSLCHDAITPNDMRSSVTCAWTGSLVTIGGLGCAIWVFLRSLWLHIRIFWDRELGRKFKWGSILAGTILPVIFLIAVLTSTGFSYRMGQMCLPNSENAIVTFWVWLVIFAILGFVLQVVTTGYCVFVYLRSRHRDQRQARNSVQRSRAMADRQTWKTVKKLFLLQWRNILVSIFTILGSIAFFIVFFTQDSKLGRVFNDPKNIKPVKTWIVCQTLSRGDREECRRYVSGFTVPRTSVLASLILASLVGIEIFILLFRHSMILAWRDLLHRLFYRAKAGRPPTPELTSLESPGNFGSASTAKQNPFVSVNTASPTTSGYNTEVQTPAAELDSIAPVIHRRPVYDRIASDAVLLTPASQQFQPSWDSPSTGTSRPATPAPAPFNSPREVPAPPARSQSTASKTSFFSRKGSSKANRASTGMRSGAESPSIVRGRISNPVPGTFVHVEGVSKGSPTSAAATGNASGDATAAAAQEYWPGEADSWDQERERGLFV